MLLQFDVFSTVHHNIELFHLPILMHNSLFINKCMLHYYPRHVSSINMPIFRRTNCIHTASGNVALCKRLHSTPVEIRLTSLTTCMLHYYPRHVSSINMPIFRRKNCIHTASGIVALRKRLHSTLVESRLTSLTICMLHYYPRHVSSMGMLMLETCRG